MIPMWKTEEDRQKAQKIGQKCLASCQSLQYAITCYQKTNNSHLMLKVIFPDQEPTMVSRKGVGSQKHTGPKARKTVNCWGQTFDDGL